MQMPRAWLVLARLRARHAHAGLCHVSSTVYSSYVTLHYITLHKSYLEWPKYKTAKPLPLCCAISYYVQTNMIF